MEIRSPVRVTHRHTQRVPAPSADVFPLLCPVREKDWIPGWGPRLVISESGVAEEGAVFFTEVEGHEATWVITDHDPEGGRIRMIQLVPDLVLIQLDIVVRPVGDEGTECDVAYTYTALSDSGEAFVGARTPEQHKEFLARDWVLLNQYLERAP